MINMGKTQESVDELKYVCERDKKSYGKGVIQDNPVEAKVINENRGNRYIGIIFTSKIGDGKEFEPIIIRPSEIEKNHKVLVEKLADYGLIIDDEICSIKGHVEYLIKMLYKENEVVDRCSIRTKEVISAQDSYELLLDDIKNNPRNYSVGSYLEGDCEGIIEKDSKDSNSVYLIIKGENLKDIIGVDNKGLFENIKNQWKTNNLLVSDSREKRHTIRRVLTKGGKVASAYKIKIDNSIYEYVKKKQGSIQV